MLASYLWSLFPPLQDEEHTSGYTGPGTQLPLGKCLLLYCRCGGGGNSCLSSFHHVPKGKEVGPVALATEGSQGPAQGCVRHRGL